MGDIRDRLNHQDSIREQIRLAQGELEKLCKQDERMLRLVRQAEELKDAIGNELGKLADEHRQARLTWLLIVDARGDVCAHISRTRAHIERLQEALV